jgi:hypothetical protein
MPEIVNPPTEDPAAELARLRTANAELTAKAKTRKERIATLESENAAIRTQLHEATVGGPMKAVAADLFGSLAEVFTEQFNKRFKTELKEGKLCVFDLEGKPLNGNDGKQVEFSRESLYPLLSDQAEPLFPAFAKSVVITKASGGAAVTPQSSAAKPVETVHLGLR